MSIDTDGSEDGGKDDDDDDDVDDAAGNDGDVDGDGSDDGDDGDGGDGNGGDNASTAATATAAAICTDKGDDFSSDNGVSELASVDRVERDGVDECWLLLSSSCPSEAVIDG